MQREEKALREDPADELTNGVGHFWKIRSTRPYMHTRLDYRAALTFVRNVESVRAQLDHLQENLRLCRSDNLGSRDLIPSLMVRLNQDQECYDFMKWWATSANDNHYDWSNMSLPYLDIKHANPLEKVDCFVKGSIDIAHLVTLTLVKIKLYFILYASYGAQAKLGMSDKQRAIVDEMMQLRNSSIARHPNVANLTSLEVATQLDNLKAQIRTLYDAVNSMNPFVWPEFIDPDESLNSAPSMYSPGSKEEMQAVTMWTWQSWNETFGALEFIYSVVKGQPVAFGL
jgi:hypothetical protein